jgi:putative ATPase
MGKTLRVWSETLGFPKPLCARVMLRTVRDWLSRHPTSSVREVNLCNIDALTAEIFDQEARRAN